ncbi:MAG TPA: sigma factor [Trueperaceae bacterium]
MGRAEQQPASDIRISSDEDLVELMAERDEAALRETFRRYAPFIVSMAERMGLDGEAQEFTQEVFIRLWEGARRFDRMKAGARTWIVTTAHRMAIRRLGGYGPLDLRGGSPQPDDLAGEPLYLSDALDRLDPLARQLLELAFFGGHDHRQLVERSGRSPATVHTALKRALASLHDAAVEVRR